MGQAQHFVTKYESLGRKECESIWRLLCLSGTMYTKSILKDAKDHHSIQTGEK